MTIECLPNTGCSSLLSNSTIIILFGLHFLGLFRISLFYKEARFEANVEGASLLGAYLIGLAFAFGWRPCVGPVLAAILFTAAGQDTAVQGASLLGLMRAEDARMMAVAGSWSGAIIGGLMFGIGMVLARGCSGRLLVLAATGNMRSIVSGLIFAVIAQMSLGGWLTPAREYLAGLWVTPGGRNVDLLSTSGMPDYMGLVIGVALAVLALEISRRNRIGFGRLNGA